MIAFICATSGELSCLVRGMRDAADLYSPPGTRLTRGELEGLDVLAMACGVGKVPAAAGTRYLMDKHAVDSLVGYGAAGALSPLLKVGDLVIASELVFADTGVAHSRSFEPTGPGVHSAEGLRFVPVCKSSPTLVELAAETAAAAGLSCRRGRTITCDQVVMDPELRRHLGERFDALAVEMEGAAAALVASGEGVPFLAVRAVSDELHHDLIGLERLLPRQGQSRRGIWARRFFVTVTHPVLLARAREFSSGMKAALDTLSAFLPELARRLDRGLPTA